ncbi:MAG: polysaccharide biosynthesis tyrosine autokinase, partial [Candidatus Omnitrophica bacterium]|nr:polysaccharide biosynthesis tyrosine autokinase [Candidatus Omnitrophota bacterium]
MAQYELNLRDYLRIFRKRKYTILAIFLLVTIISIFSIGFSKESVIYHSSITIKIEQGKTIAGLLTEWIAYNPANIMASEARTIKGFPVMKNVVLRLGKVRPDSSMEDINEAITELQKSIEVEKVSDTNMIRITAIASTAKGAVNLANIVAESYIEENLKEKSKQASQARIFIAEQLAALEKRIKDAEDGLKTLGKGARNVRLSEPTQQKLQDLEFQLAEMQQRYTAKHPKVIQTKEQIKELEKQMQGFSSQDIDYARYSREAEVNRKLYGTLKERLEEARITEAQKVSDVSIVDPAVTAVATIPKDNRVKILIGAILGVILGIAFAFISETLDTSIGTIEDVENVIKLPVLGVVPSLDRDPNIKKSLLANFKDRFWTRNKTEEESRYCRLISHYKPQSPIAESYRNINTNLKLGSSRKTIMVTSSGPQEGKSCVVCNLGIVMGQVGLKTLLVSTDLRRPALSRTFGIKKEPGLNEFFMGTVDLDSILMNITDIMLGEMKFEEVRKTPGIENIWIMPSGKHPANPVEILESKRMKDMIEKGSARFDVIIFDSPPVLPVTDASILAPNMDCVVLVYEIGRTSREALMRAKVQMESAGGKIAGVILNHTRPQTESISAYPYYHYRYRYYGRDESQDGKSKIPGKKKE